MGWFQQLGIKEPKAEEFESIVNQFMARSEKELKAGFILEAIIEREGIKLTPEEEEQKLKELSEQYQMDLEKFKARLTNEILERFRQRWLEDKALDFLFSVSKISIKKVSTKDSSEVGKNIDLPKEE